jgi:uncharacterized membrane protein
MAAMKASLAAFHAKLDIVDTLGEYIDELRLMTIQLQTMPVVGNIFVD